MLGFSRFTDLDRDTRGNTRGWDPEQVVSRAGETDREGLLIGRERSSSMVKALSAERKEVVVTTSVFTDGAGSIGNSCSTSAAREQLRRATEVDIEVRTDADADVAGRVAQDL